MTAMEMSAVLSPCGLYRYRLGRRWAAGPPLVFVMLNPSTADAEVDDATIRRCTTFARAHGYGAIDVVNLYAYRCTEPRDLRVAYYPVGPDNDAHTAAAVVGAGAVCLAWGAHAAGLARPREVLAAVRSAGVQPQCLQVTRGGQPQHPLMLPASCRLHPYTGTAHG